MTARPARASQGRQGHSTKCILAVRSLLEDVAGAFALLRHLARGIEVRLGRLRGRLSHEELVELLAASRTGWTPEELRTLVELLLRQDSGAGSRGFEGEPGDERERNSDVPDGGDPTA